MDQKHFTASAFIIYKNKVLLHKHKKLKLLLQPGGHIEENESPEETVLREVKEETGLEIELYKSKDYRIIDSTKELNCGVHLNLHPVGEHSHIDFVFYAKAITTKIKPDNKETGKNWQWYTKEEVLTNPEIVQNVKIYCLEALEIFKE